MKNSGYSVWKDINFIWLWIGTTLSAFGDGAYFILLGWYVIDVTKSDLALGTALICSSIPRIIFMLFGGVAADRISKKTILIVSMLTRIVVLCMFSMYLWHLHGGVAIYLVYIMAIVFGTVDAFFWPANQSMVPSLVPKSAIGTANSVIQTSQILSMAVGPLVASLLLWLPSYPVMFLAVSICFLTGIFGLMPMKLQHTVNQKEANELVDGQHYDVQNPETKKGSPLRDLVEGIRYVRSIRVLTFIMVVSLFINLLFMGPANIGLPTLVKQLHWSGSNYAYLEGALGVGGITGGVLAGLLKNLRGHFLWLSSIGAVFGFAFLFVGWVHILPIQLILMGTSGLCMSLLNIPILTYVQTITQTKMIGRVMSLLTLMSIGLIPVSYAVSSFLLQLHIVNTVDLIVISGAFMGIFSLTWLFIKEFRTMEEYPAWKNALVSTNHESDFGDSIS